MRALWRTVLGRQWMAFSGVPLGAGGQPANRKDRVPYLTRLLGAIVIAGMMRHVFVLGGIDTVGKGLLSGLGIGLFLVYPQLATFYVFSAKPHRLFWTDGDYASFGCAVMGAVLTLV